MQLPGAASPSTCLRVLTNTASAAWLTATHTNFMVHAAAAAAARTSATAIKKYCQRRMVDNYIVRTVDNAPPLVPRPGDV